MTELQFRKYGDPPYRVVVVHGGPGAVGEMAAVAHELSSAHGVIESLHRKLSVAGQISELKDVIEKQASFPVYLIGFSWGAWLSLLFAAEYKEFVHKLILIGSGPLDATFAAEVFTTRLNRLNKKDQQKFRFLLNTLAHENIKDLSSALAELDALIRTTDSFEPASGQEGWIDLHPEVFIKVWKEAEYLRKSGVLLKAAQKIDRPIHVIHGEYDPHPAPAITNPLKQFGKDFQYNILTKCGHKPWIEKYARSHFFFLLHQILSV